MDSTRPAAQQAPQRFFIVGAPRSGTTLLAALLDRHPRVAVTPETDFYLRPPERRGGADGDVAGAFLALPRAEDLGLLPDDIRRHAPRPAQPRRSAPLRAALDAYAAKHAAAWVGEKTPEHLFYIDRIRADFADSRIVCVQRDGRDVALSLLRAGFTHDLLRVHCQRWLRATDAARRAAERWPEHFRVVLFEDLLSNPDATLRETCGFLGIDYCETMLTADPPGTTRLVPERERAWKGKAIETLDPSRGEAWRREAGARRLGIMEGIMGRELERLGYPLSSSLGSSHSSSPNSSLSTTPDPPIADHRRHDALLATASRALHFLAYRVLRPRLPAGAANALLRRRRGARSQ